MKHILSTFLAASLALGAGVASAEQYPDGPLTWVIPFGAGGGTDQVIRNLQTHSGNFFPDAWDVENRPGAGGTVGWLHMLDQDADGQTVLVGSVTPLITVLQEGNPPFTPDDIRVVAYYSLADLTVITRADNAWSNFDEFIAHAEANPGDVTIGGSNAALLPLAYIFDQMKLDITLIPYGGGGDALTDVVGGHIDGVSIGTNRLGNLGDDLIGLAVFGEQDIPDTSRELYGDIPWIGDYGVNGMSVPRYVGVHPDTPDEVVEALNAMLGEMLTDETLLEEFAARGERITYYPTDQAQEEFNRFVKATETFLPLLNQ